jgi:SAM-dependent methyltransferase
MNWHARFTQQARWTEQIRRYLLQRAGLSSSMRLLEVGCGTGAVLSTLAESGCQVHGLDLEDAFLLQAKRNTPAAALVQGDAHFLPYAEASFDIVCCHFLLLWVVDPARVLAEMRRILRPGGWLLALAEPDYGGRIDYPDELIQLGALQEAALRRQGAETRLGRRLAALFHAAGLQEVETGVLGGQWRAAPAPEDLAQEWQVLQADLGGALPPEELARLRQSDAQAWASGARVLFVPTFYAAGRKKR